MPDHRVGKTVLARRLLRGDAPSLAETFGVRHSSPCTLVHANACAQLDVPSGDILLHYELRPHGHQLFGGISGDVVRVLHSADRIEFVMLWETPAVLLARLRARRMSQLREHLRGRGLRSVRSRLRRYRVRRSLVCAPARAMAVIRKLAELLRTVRRPPTLDCQERSARGTKSFERVVTRDTFLGIEALAGRLIPSAFAHTPVSMRNRAVPRQLIAAFGNGVWCAHVGLEDSAWLGSAQRRRSPTRPRRRWPKGIGEALARMVNRLESLDTEREGAYKQLLGLQKRLNTPGPLASAERSDGQ